jgi:hypothetical protein
MDHKLSQLPDSELEWPRCDTLMKNGGSLGIPTQRDRLPQAWLLSHAHANIVEFETFACPNCGKVEFFL